MHVSTALARFLPTDPGYKPFGLSWLRGLNVLHFALVGFVGLLFAVEGIAIQLNNEEPPTLTDALAGAVRQALMTAVMFTPMLVLITIADNVSSRFATGTRVAWLAAAMLLGALVHALTWIPVGCVFDWVERWEPECEIFALDWGRLGTFTRASLWGVLFTALLYFYKRERDAAQRLHDTHLQRLNAQRQETEARLRSLQAQIEPHFLFNTLAHIQRFYQVRPQQGRAMLRNLIDYLHSALPQMREPESTLGRELALARAYLNVQQTRMGERLKVEIDVPQDLLDARLPPMMLLTLAENAIKHGLGPKREGGTLRISARRVSGRLEVEVGDDGVGLTIGAGTGRGLSNTRARLATMFGARGAVDIDNNAAGGVRAVLALPFARAHLEAGRA